MSVDKVEIIKDRLTMDEVLRQYGYTPKKRMPCPLHNGVDKNFEIKGRYWRCYSHCGNGDTISFVQQLFGLSFPDTLKKIDADFNLGLYEHISNRKKLNIEKQAYQRKKERERQKQEVENIKNRYWLVFDEWVRLDRNKTLHAPKTPEEACHPLFVEALQKLAYQEYLLDCAENEVYEIEHRNHSGIHS